MEAKMFNYEKLMALARIHFFVCAESCGHFFPRLVAQQASENSVNAIIIYIFFCLWTFTKCCSLTASPPNWWRFNRKKILRNKNHRTAKQQQVLDNKLKNNIEQTWLSFSCSVDFFGQLPVMSPASAFAMATRRRACHKCQGFVSLVGLRE